eukprot:CFRG1790T1
MDSQTLDLFMMRAHTVLMDLQSASVDTPLGSDSCLFEAAFEEVIQLLVKKGPELKNYHPSRSRQSAPYAYYMHGQFLDDDQIEFVLDDIV